MTSSLEQPRLVLHLILQLDTGGLENGLINLIRHLPPERYRHAIVCLKDYPQLHARIPETGVHHGMRARSQVIAHPSVPAMARGYAAIYDSLGKPAAPCPHAGAAGG